MAIKVKKVKKPKKPKVTGTAKQWKAYEKGLDQYVAFQNEKERRSNVTESKLSKIKD